MKTIFKTTIALALAIALALPLVACGNGDTSADAQEYLLQGQEALDSGRYGEAVEHYDMAIEIDPGNADAYDARATAYLNRALTNVDDAVLFLGDLIAAFGDLSKVIELDPENADAYIARGSLCTSLAELLYESEFDTAIDLLNGAISDLTAAFKLDPENTATLHSMAGCIGVSLKIGQHAMLIGRYEEALGVFNLAVEFGPRNAAIYELRADVLQALGEEGLAAADRATAESLRLRE